VRYRRLGDSDLRVSEICLGTWTTFGESVPDDAAVTIVDAVEHDQATLRAIDDSLVPA
jgi:aryl-alcohol dehydrogenase-like predicted oxidoreductase